MTREIPLTRGYIALVDDEDFDGLTSMGRWFAFTMNHSPIVYARRNSARSDGVRRGVLMHNVLLGALYVDHIDGNGLNNARANLRTANRSQNRANAGISSNNTTGYKGVSKSRGRFAAGIHVNGTSIHLGRFDSKEDAARAYDQAALQAFGEFARLNFPEGAA